MRFVVLLLGFLASVLTAALGVMYFYERSTQAWLRDNDLAVLNFFINPTEKHLALSGLFLFIGAGYCLLGALLAFFRCGWQGAVLMVVSIVGPAILSPITLLVTAPQLLAGLLACFVRPLPVTLDS